MHINGGNIIMRGIFYIFQEQRYDESVSFCGDVRGMFRILKDEYIVGGDGGGG